MAKSELDIISSKSGDDSVIVEITGRVTEQNAKEFHHDIEKAYRKGTPRVVLDVSGICFLTSAGLGTIMYFHTLMRKERRRLIILNSGDNPSAYLDELFETTNLDKVLSVVRQL
ncbi:MAG: STAS domain-containing protein [Chitinispirillaceae bacterium]|nr:STAS domain-containing protein [Chitinispirillaceae bacterium]